jgi:kynurenine formamidase
MSKTNGATSIFVDVSHTVEHGMITYKGLPAPLICDFLSREDSRAHYASGTEFQIGKIEMVANTGTYLDSPFHRYADGTDLAGLSLESLAELDGLVLRFAKNWSNQISKSDLLRALEGRPISGKAVLVHTGWDKHWNTDRYFEGHPFLSEDAAHLLADSRAAMVGIDSLNIDDITDGQRPVHSLLLGAGIPIVEHLCNLDRLPESNFRFSAVPVKVRGMGTFPVRAYGRLSCQR